ncbi:MAG: hypothetical protein ABJE95_13600 [Byssovorax sp.]
MNRTRATFLLAAASLLSLGATGCHHHRMARGVYPTAAYQPVMYRQAAPPPIVIVVETRGQAAPEVAYTEDNSAQEAAAREATAREEAMRQAQIARERARIEREQAERARIEQARARQAQEQARRDAEARAAAQGGTTIIVLSPGQKPVQVDGTWFQGQQ